MLMFELKEAYIHLKEIEKIGVNSNDDNLYHIQDRIRSHLEKIALEIDGTNLYDYQLHFNYTLEELIKCYYKSYSYTICPNCERKSMIKWNPERTAKIGRCGCTFIWEADEFSTLDEGPDVYFNEHTSIFSKKTLSGILTECRELRKKPTKFIFLKWLRSQPPPRHT